MSHIYNTRIASIRSIPSPQEITHKNPITSEIEALVNTTRTNISHILHRDDQRLIAIVGPCSIHDPESALVYAEKLNRLRAELSDQLEIIMRIYFEKPRTTVGWKGLINDPELNNSFNINRGIELARQIMIKINQMGLPTGSEFLDIVTGQYYSDLVSWGAIGARTTESQVHRELASGLSCPIGFKNGTSGNVQIAIDAVKSSHHKHVFLSPTHEGTTAIFETTGNKDAHIILRGGEVPNYDTQSIKRTIALQEKAEIETGVIIDLSHANSLKQYKKQIDVANNVGAQIANGNHNIVGVMIESHLIEGRQSVTDIHSLRFGQSITDGCLGWDDTEIVLRHLAEKVIQRNR